MSTEKKPIDKKTLLIIILPIVGLFLVYMVMFYKKHDKKEVKIEKKEAVVIPDVNDTSSVQSSKVSVYEQEKHEAEQEKQKERRSNVKEDDFFNMSGNEEETANTDEDGEKKKEQAKVQEQKDKPKVVYVYRENTKKVDKSKESKVDDDAGSSGFGVTPGTGKDKKNSNSNQGSNTKSSNDKETIVKKSNSEFIPAYLEEDCTIKSNTDVIFILHKDITIDGVFFKKLSMMYGNASEAASYFDIKVRRIKNAKDGQMYDVSLELFNENYSKGIKYEGGVNKAVQGTGTDAVNESSSEVPYTGNAVVDVGSSIVKKTANRLRGENKVKLYQGYEVYFKKIEKER